MSCLSHYHGEVLVICPQDLRIDEQIARARQTEIKGLIGGAKHRKVLLNFENVSYVCSEMLGSLVRIVHHCRSEAITIKFCGLSGEMLDQAGLDGPLADDT